MDHQKNNHLRVKKEQNLNQLIDNHRKKKYYQDLDKLIQFILSNNANNIKPKDALIKSQSL